MQATVNLATETALVRAALSEPDSTDDTGPHNTRLQALGDELAQVWHISAVSMSSCVCLNIISSELISHAIPCPTLSCNGL